MNQVDLAAEFREFCGMSERERSALVDADPGDIVSWSRTHRKIKSAITGRMDYISYADHPFLEEPLQVSFAPGARSVWIKGRQLGLSEAVITGAHWWAITRPNTNILYGLQDFTQLRLFSSTKLGPMYDETPEIARALGIGKQGKRRNEGIALKAWKSVV